MGPGQRLEQTGQWGPRKGVSMAKDDFNKKRKFHDLTYSVFSSLYERNIHSYPFLNKKECNYSILF